MAGITARAGLRIIPPSSIPQANIVMVPYFLKSLAGMAMARAWVKALKKPQTRVLGVTAKWLKFPLVTKTTVPTTASKTAIRSILRGICLVLAAIKQMIKTGARKTRTVAVGAFEAATV